MDEAKEFLCESCNGFFPSNHDCSKTQFSTDGAIITLSPIAVAIIANDLKDADELAGLKEESDWAERAAKWRPSLEVKDGQ